MSCWNWLRFLFYFILLPYFNKTILILFCLHWNFWLAYCKISNKLDPLRYQVCWKEKKFHALVHDSCYIQSGTHKPHTLINYFTMYSYQSIRSTNCYTLTILIAAILLWCLSMTVQTRNNAIIYTGTLSLLHPNYLFFNSKKKLQIKILLTVFEVRSQGCYVTTIDFLRFVFIKSTKPTYTSEKRQKVYGESTLPQCKASTKLVSWNWK